MTRRGRRVVYRMWVIVAFAAGLGSWGCAVDGLAFRVDDRVDIVAPDDREEIRLPLTVRWTAPDYEGEFGVLVDRAPQPPGKPLSWLVRGDDNCRRSEGCPDEAYLAERNVYVTDGTSLTLETLDDTVTEARRGEFHEVTIVLLDERRRRVGESAWSVELRVRQEEGG